MGVTNPLAYYDTAAVTAVRSVIVVLDQGLYV